MSNEREEILPCHIILLCANYQFHKWENPISTVFTKTTENPLDFPFQSQQPLFLNYNSSKRRLSFLMRFPFKKPFVGFPLSFFGLRPNNFSN